MMQASTFKMQRKCENVPACAQFRANSAVYSVIQKEVSVFEKNTRGCAPAGVKSQYFACIIPRGMLN
jgi:hypothetical protein